MKFDVTVNANKSLRDLQEHLNKRIANVATEVGRAVADQTATEVKRRLGGARSGWVRIYYEAINFLESIEGDEWAVAGLSERSDLFKLCPANESLLEFPEYPPDSTTQTLASNQPWPVDLVPTIRGSYPGKAVIRPSSPTEVETYRQARLANLPNVIALLEEQGATIDDSPGAMPHVDRVYADIQYLAHRLEKGFADFPRIPHWGPALSSLRANGEKWASRPEVRRLVENAILGKEPGKVATMSPALVAELARIRASTWS